MLSGCVTSSGAIGQGGAGFNDAAVAAPGIQAQDLFELCWPEDAASQQRVSLVTLDNGEVMFDAQEGATNSTARCIREIATTLPGKRPPGEVLVAPPTKRPSGWAVLGYVQLLSPTRFGPERGLLNPAGLVRGCLSQGDTLRSGVRFAVAFGAELTVQIESSDGVIQPALTDSERCIEAVLGATIWPNTRAFKLDFNAKDPKGTGAAGDVGHYFGLVEGAAQGLDPMKVKEAISVSGPAVGGCWEAAMMRRAGLSGGRSLRMRVDASGAVKHLWVVGNVSAEPKTAADYLLDACVVDAVRKARFPAGTAGDGVYSWVFAERR